MMRSLFSGVSGLKAHQTMMDVVGDNIANINTAGFKGSRVVFADTLSQVLRGPAGATATNGGTNGEQIGLGVRVAGITMINTQGASLATGSPTDVAIGGEGYFVVRSGAESLYTRAGSFNFDDRGNLTDPTGAIVQGWPADLATGQVNTNAPATDMRIPLGQSIAPTATTKVTLGGNLSTTAAADATSTISTSVGVIDSLGAETRVRLDFTKTGDNAWSMQAYNADGTTLGAALPMTFDGTTGALNPITPAPTLDLPGTNGATNTVFALDFGAPGAANALTQFGGTSGFKTVVQDGAPTGYLRSYAIGEDGTLSGSFSNGRVKSLGQIAVAGFTNPVGLVKAGGSHMRASAASGTPAVGVPGVGGQGSLIPGSLEGSNVDLATEFTNLMIAQRGFQANSKIISTSDEMLQALVDLKR